MENQAGKQIVIIPTRRRCRQPKTPNNGSGLLILSFPQREHGHLSVFLVPLTRVDQTKVARTKTTL